MSNYKIIMTGGGTAGHVTPNLALVPKLKEKGFDIPTDVVTIEEAHNIIFQYLKEKNNA